MLKSRTKRSFAFFLSACLLLSLCPTGAIAADYKIGDTVTTNTNTAPEAVEGAVWVQTDSTNCSLIEHTHADKCYYKSCDHATANINGHLQSCYGSGWGECTHSDDSEHTGKVTISISNIGSLSGANAELYDYLVSLYGKRGLYKAYGKSFCYSIDFDNLSCAHVCSEVGGDCYSMYCPLSEHTHVKECFTYTWMLKADVNKNGVADDEDTYYTVKYVNDGEVILEESVLVDMPTPTVANPSKKADAQYTYTFVGWNSPVAEKVTDNVTYTAVYNNAVNKYTVTWVDENSTLEVDENVAYGTMPTYDGKEPSKKGDNTVSYTFAGWTPSVDVVTGDVTYTATYTTKNVYTVQFVIDGETVKTEYVVDGDTATAYNPTRDHYKLSAWHTQDNKEYDFASAVQESITLSAEWILVECDVKVEANNASHDYSAGSSVSVGSSVTINITPDAGYAVDSVTVNGKLADVTYNDGIATIAFKAEGDVESYTVIAATKKAKLSLDSTVMNVYGDLSADSIFNAVYDSTDSYPSGLTVDDVSVEYKAYSISILGKEYEWWAAPGTDVSLEKFLDKFGLGSLANYIPATELPHAFGAESVELVRVSYAGNDKYPQVSATTQVTLKDNRLETQVNLNEGVSVVYGASEKDILELIFESVTAKNSTVTTDTNDVTMYINNLNAGTHTAIVSYSGDKTYAASSAEVEVIIEKADSYVNVDYSITKYGSPINVSNLISSNASCIEIVAGIALGSNASANAGFVTRVNIPAIIDVDSIENDAVRDIAKKLINKATSSVSGNMTVSELKSALEAALPYLEQIEDSGYIPNLNANAISTLFIVLDKLSAVEGVGDMTLDVSIGESISISDAGAYLVAGVAADGNYNTSYGMNYSIITPDGYRANLAWDVEDENGVITIAALKGGYNLGAHVTDVAEGTIADAEAHLVTIFVGVKANGDIIITEDQSELDFGAYTEIAFMLDFGNTSYYAKPIIREIVVAADVVNVNFIDENGNINDDRVFNYGEAVAMTAKAFDRNTGKEVTDGTIKYLYTGVQANGKAYFSDVAPINSGVYTVIATYIDNNGHEVGAGVAALAIKPADADFSISDNTVVCDGNEHFVNVDNPLGLKYISVITDENGNVNVVLPSDWDVRSLDELNNIKDVANKLASLDVFGKLPTEYQNDILSELNDILAKIDQKVDINSITINGAYPSEVGTYNVIVAAFGDYNYKIAIDAAALVIEPAECAHIAGPEVKENITSSDCTTEYDIVVYCKACGEEMSRTHNSSTIHTNPYSVIVDASSAHCVTDGFIVRDYYCSACDTKIDTRTTVIPANGTSHVPSEEVKENEIEATETTGGSYDLVVYCALCDEEISRHKVTVPALGHTHKPVALDAVAPTCEITGLTAGLKCFTCGEIITAQSVIPALGHTHEIVTGKPATCTGGGLTDGIRCSVCDKALEEQKEVAALGHTPEMITGRPATCTEEGIENGVVCSVCDEILEAQSTIPVLGHTNAVIAGSSATCTETGLTDGVKCSVCDIILEEQVEIPALGHTPGEAVKENEIAATETSKGSYDLVVYCSVCDAEISRDTVSVPVIDGGTDSTEETEEVETPDSPGSPETGDAANIALWIVASVVSCGAIMLLIFKKNKFANAE